MKLDHLAAIVTGVGSGIGRAISIRFAAEGARVVVADLVAKRAQAMADLLTGGGAQVIAVPVDVTREDQIAAMVVRANAAFGQYGPFGVRVNCIAPVTIRTAAWQERFEQDPEVFAKLARWYPLRRVGEPEDVANAALFLVSDEASWITGEVLAVDGGLLAGNGLIGGDIPR